MATFSTLLSRATMKAAITTMARVIQRRALSAPAASASLVIIRLVDSGRPPARSRGEPAADPRRRPGRVQRARLRRRPGRRHRAPGGPEQAADLLLLRR